MVNTPILQEAENDYFSQKLKSWIRYVWFKTPGISHGDQMLSPRYFVFHRTITGHNYSVLLMGEGASQIIVGRPTVLKFSERNLQSSSLDPPFSFYRPVHLFV